MAYFDNIQLTTDNGDIYYPQTRTNSVFDNNNESLETRLLHTISAGSNSTVGVGLPKDADTLNGNTSSYFENRDTNTNIASFIEAETDINIASGETHGTIFGKLLKSIKSLRTSITNINNNLNGSFKSLTYNSTYAVASAGCNNSLSKIGKLAHIIATFDTVQAVPSHGTLINLDISDSPDVSYGSYITITGMNYSTVTPMSFVLSPSTGAIYSDNALPANTRFILSLSYRVN